MLPLVLAPFIAFCVMVGLHWSIKSKGTIGSLIGAVGLVIVVVGVVSLCGVPAGKGLNVIGSAMSTFSPLNALYALVYPEQAIPDALKDDVVAARMSLVIGAMLTAAAYTAVSYGMHTNMKRTFMMTVRRLAGTS